MSGAWHEQARHLHSLGFNYSAIARQLLVHPSVVSRLFSGEGRAEIKADFDADSDMLSIREPRVPKRIIKSNDDVMALARKFAAGLITRSELMKGIAA